MAAVGTERRRAAEAGWIGICVSVATRSDDRVRCQLKPSDARESEPRGFNPYVDLAELIVARAGLEAAGVSAA
jgi:hypothetical protein